MLLYARYNFNSILNPLTIFVGVNIISIIMSLITDGFTGYSSRLILDILIMFSSFFLGLMLCKYIKGRYVKIVNYRVISEERLKKVIIFASVIYNIALVLYLRNMFENYSILMFFENLSEVNKYVQSDEFKGGLFNYIVPMGLPLSLLILYYLKNYRKSRFLIIQYILCFMYCISPRRSEMFNFVLITIVYVLCSRQYNFAKSLKKSFAYVLLSIIIIISLMAYTQSLLGKETDRLLSILGCEVPTYLTSPYLYISLNYPYLDALNYQDVIDVSTPFSALFRLIYIASNSLFGTEIDVVNQFDLGFIQLGKFYSNTAPLLYYTYRDLGPLFFIEFILLGIVSYKAYLDINSSSITKKIFGCFIYCFLLLSFRSDLVIFLTYVLGILYIYVFKFILSVKK